MRFPTAKMVLDYSKFNLVIKGANAQIEITPWDSAMTAKGKLQVAWFKVRGIPVDQRGIRTIAKVGGLVGKTMKIDESTRYKPEYVRIQIACRDIMQVPASAEGNLGLHIYDFFFDLDEPIPVGKEKNKNTVSVEDSQIQPSPKKPRNEGPRSNVERSETTQGKTSFYEAGGSGKTNVLNTEVGKLSTSAPPKMDMHNMKDMTTSWREVAGKDLDSSQEDGEIIPAATYEPSKDHDEDDFDERSERSDDYATKAFKILGSEAESSRAREEFWLARCDKISPVKGGPADRDTVFENKEGDGEEHSVLNVEKLINPVEEMRKQREDRRYSARIQSHSAGVQEEQAKAGKKRSFEGTRSNHNSFSILEDCDIVDRSNNMGVVINSINFEQIVVLKELEIARHALFTKNLEENMKKNGDSKEDNPELSDKEASNNLLEWEAEESSASEGDVEIPIRPVRTRRATKRLSLSGKKR
ncbi:unnamed protein product [Urochloa humidicola]